MKQKIIIGLVGEFASGKDTVAAYLAEKYHSETVSFSQPLRKILDMFELPQTRKNMSWLGTDLRARFGQDVLARAITKDINESKKAIVTLPNVRIPRDITYLKKMPGFHLVAITADAKIRFKRLKKRRQNADDKNKTWAQFLADAKFPTETKIRQIAKKAKFTIDNNGTFDQLYRQVDRIIKSIKL